MKTFLVTGGAHGIGAGIAQKLAAAGPRVIVADRRRASLPGIEDRPCDVGDEDAVRALLAGIETLDGIVCNAGFMVRKPVEALSLDEWNGVLATNLTSTFLLAKHGAAKLRARKGAIVTIASTRAHMSEPDTESYAASKGGLLALSHALAVSLGPDIRVNCISPGWINSSGAALSETDHAQHPAGRVGTVADVAELAAFLLDGAKSGFCTGAEFVVDGGMTRKMIYAE